MRQFIKPDWKAINKAISTGSESRGQLRQELNDLRKAIDNKIETHLKREKEFAVQERIKMLHNIKVGETVYYIGKSESIPFGTPGEKIKDGRTRMVVRINTMKESSWTIYYTNLQSTPPTEVQISQHKDQISIDDL